MSCGKIAEGLKIYMRPMRISGLSAGTVYWNGQPVTTSPGTMLDTQGYEESLGVLGIGVFQGATATLSNSVWHSDTDNPMAATLITGASFADLNQSNNRPSVMPEAAARAKSFKRYIALRTEVTYTTQSPTIDFTPMVILGKAKTEPVSKTLDFDLDA